MTAQRSIDTSVHAGPGSARNREKHILRAGWLIDGQGGPPAPDQVIVIHQGRIVSIKAYDCAEHQGTRLTDLGGSTVLPALMDAHVHLALSGTTDPDLRRAQLSQTPEQAEQLIAKHLQTHMENGIVAVRDAGDRLGQVLKTKSGKKSAVHLAATCWAWHAPGRYGAMIGRAPRPGQMPLSRAVAQAPQGQDHIKLIQSGINSLDVYGLETAPQFSESELALVRRFALSEHLRVMVHANGRQAVRQALIAGCDSIEHGYFMERGNIHRMADRQVFWVPTVVPMDALTREGLLSPARADVARRTVEHQLTQIATAFQAGVPIALGTDAGSLGADHGLAVQRELALLMDAGLPLPQAVKCAALNVARLMGLTDRGAVLPGWRADLIVVNGGPESLPHSLGSIAGLYVDGHWLNASFAARPSFSSV